MSVDRSKRSRIPSRKLRDEANDAEPEVASHRDARNQARHIINSTPSAPTAGTSSKQQPSAVVVDKAQAQINHSQATVASTAQPATTSACTGSKRQSIDDDKEITNAEGK